MECRCQSPERVRSRRHECVIDLPWKTVHCSRLVWHITSWRIRIIRSLGTIDKANRLRAELLELPPAFRWNWSEDRAVDRGAALCRALITYAGITIETGN
jgi:hypothetical protein